MLAQCALTNHLMNCPSSSQDLPQAHIKTQLQNNSSNPFLWYMKQRIYTFVFHPCLHNYSRRPPLRSQETHSDSLLISHHCSFKYQRITWRSRNHFFTKYYFCILSFMVAYLFSIHFRGHGFIGTLLTAKGNASSPKSPEWI